MQPGDYQTTLTVSTALPDSYSLFAVQTISFTVELTVFAQPKLTVNVSNTAFNYTVGGTPPGPFQISLANTDNSPIAFSAVAASNGNWLSVTPTNGSTPAQLSVSANVSGLVPTTTSSMSGTITIQGPSNTQTVVFSLTIAPSTPPLVASPPSVSFTQEASASAVSTSFISYTRLTGVSASVATQSGGPWLTIQSMTQAGAQPSITISASSANLAAGIYRGVVTLTSVSAGIVQVPVTMTVIAAPTAQTRFTVTPASIDLTAPAGQPFFAQTIQIASNDGPHIVTATSNVGSLTAIPPGQTLASTVTFSFSPSASLPNQSGAITFNWTGGSFTIPVTLQTAAGPGLAPGIGAVVNAASMTANSIAPGEIITILGTAIGPAAQSFALDSSGRIAASLGGAQVTINQIRLRYSTHRPNN